jgi:hypothetical protein
MQTDVDIIAIHGLDTKSPDTWTWRENGNSINWLAHPDMLPKTAGKARIFTCDWPADLFEQSDLIPKTIQEFARLLLDGIKGRPSVTSGHASDDRPILFIASCLGGIILMEALVMADHEYLSVRRSTRAIVFLATPFGDTSFQDVASWAEPGLKAWALIQGREVTKLLGSVKGPTFDLGELLRKFTQLYLDPARPYRIMTFYELGKTNLYHKLFPWALKATKPVRWRNSPSLALFCYVRSMRTITNAR